MELKYKVLGERIREKRVKKGLTQDKLAAAIGVSNPHVSNIERGRTKVSLPTLVDICNVLDTTLDELLCNDLRKGKGIIDRNISDEIKNCSEKDSKVLYSIVRAVVECLKDMEQ